MLSRTEVLLWWSTRFPNSTTACQLRLIGQLLAAGTHHLQQLGQAVAAEARR